MKRLGRILLDAATAGSLVLFVAVAVLWVRSEVVVQDQLVLNRRAPAALRTSRVQLWSYMGAIQLTCSEYAFVERRYFDDADPANPAWLAEPSDLPRQLGLHFISRRSARRAFTGSTFWRRRGFEFKWPAPVRLPSGPHPFVLTHGYVSLPHWLLLLACAALPAVRVGRRRRTARRARRGLCPTCGYDCRATPDRCPECGRVTLTAE